jgi:DNA polymerase theta
LIFNEIIEQKKEEQAYLFNLTKLGQGILKSNQSPVEGLLIYLDLCKANQKIILSNELHLLYLLTPISLDFQVNYSLFHAIYKRLLPIEQ